MMNAAGKCVNERCRENGIVRPMYVGEWFVDDPILCPLCGQFMETVTQVGVAPAYYPLGVGRGRIGGWPQPPRPRRR